MTATAWRCSVCCTACRDNETRCPACEAPRPGYAPTKQQPAGPIAIFGGGPPIPILTTAPNPFANPVQNPFATATVQFGAAQLEPLETARFSTGDKLFTESSSAVQLEAKGTKMDGARFTFGSSQPFFSEQRAPNTPSKQDGSPSTFCAVMETPIVKPGRDSPLLIGIEPNFKLKQLPRVPMYPPPDGMVYTWGSGECDQLAVKECNLNDEGIRLSPIVIRRMSTPCALSIACGTMHSAAVMNRGQYVYTWGCNDEGPLGRPIKGMVKDVSEWPHPPAVDEGLYSCKVPAPVWGLPESERIKQVAAGDSHTAVITESGDCYCWGTYRDFFGPVGFPDFEGGARCVKPKQLRPVKIPNLKGVCIEVVAGENHTAVLTYCGGDQLNRLYVWGANDFGQLGFEPPGHDEEARKNGLFPREWTMSRFQFKRVRAKDENGNWSFVPHPESHHLNTRGSLLRVFAGKCTTFISVQCDGGDCRTFGFGRNACGELGVGCDEKIIHHPVEMKSLKNYSWTDIKGGDWFTLALGGDDSVFCWGHREYVGLGAQIAKGDDNVLEPHIIVGLKQKAKSINVGNKTAYVITLDGQLFAWGDNQLGQIGNGLQSEEIVSRPTYVPSELFDNASVLSIAAGAQHAIALVLPATDAILPEEEEAARATKKRRREEDDDEVTGKSLLCDVPHTDSKRVRIAPAEIGPSVVHLSFSQQPPLTTPPPTPVFPGTDSLAQPPSARPTKALPKDVLDLASSAQTEADTLLTQTPKRTLEEDEEEQDEEEAHGIEEEEEEETISSEEEVPEVDSIPVIRRPIPAPAETSSPAANVAKGMEAKSEVDDGATSEEEEGSEQEEEDDDDDDEKSRDESSDRQDQEDPDSEEEDGGPDKNDGDKRNKPRGQPPGTVEEDEDDDSNDEAQQSDDEEIEEKTSQEDEVPKTRRRVTAAAKPKAKGKAKAKAKAAPVRSEAATGRRGSAKSEGRKLSREPAAQVKATTDAPPETKRGRAAPSKEGRKSSRQAEVVSEPIGRKTRGGQETGKDMPKKRLGAKSVEEASESIEHTATASQKEDPPAGKKGQHASRKSAVATKKEAKKVAPAAAKKETAAKEAPAAAAGKKETAAAATAGKKETAAAAAAGKKETAAAAAAGKKETAAATKKGAAASGKETMTKEGTGKKGAAKEVATRKEEPGGGASKRVTRPSKVASEVVGGRKEAAAKKKVIETRGGAAKAKAATAVRKTVTKSTGKQPKKKAV